MTFLNAGNNGKNIIPDIKMSQRICNDFNSNDVEQKKKTHASLRVTIETIENKLSTESSSCTSEPALNNEVFVLHQVVNKTDRPAIIPATKLARYFLHMYIWD